MLGACSSPDRATMPPMARGFDDDASTRSASLDEVHRVRLTGAQVAVVSGSDAGITLPIGAAGLLVGTGLGCDLRLNDTLVSRRHLEIRPEPEGVRVVDLGSLNGTLFGGARIRDILLRQDAVFTAGGTTLSVHLLGEPLDLPLSPRTRFGDAVAVSSAMRHVFALLERAARTDVTVLLEGESGTGKEVLALAVHQESARRDGPFVVIDCGAIAEGLLESELFGHERGAFTGAAGARAGAFEQADGGTVFLDEVGELPLEAQPKLLRALESRSFRRVGGAQTIKVNVRVVAATNRRLREAVRRREFREDLFYRLAVVHVTVPRLAERPDDVGPLAETFLRRATGDAEARVPAELTRLLLSYPWPGNARELRNVVERFATFDRAEPSLLFGLDYTRAAAEPIAGAADRSGPDGPNEDKGDERQRAARIDLAGLERLAYHDAKQRLVEAFHRAVLPRAVERAGGSVPRAAEMLQIPKASLYRMLQQLRDDDPAD
jgi:transcriptional regulator with PAS, ATPase and Fis domain